MVLAMQVALSLMGGLLLVAGTVRALSTNADPVLTWASAIVLAIWLICGPCIANLQQPSARTFLWLGTGLSLWLTIVFVVPDYSWMAFVFWLLVGHLLRLLPALAISVVILLAAVFAPLAHHGELTSASVIGPAVGCLFALGVARGYLQLLKQAEQREHMLHALERAQSATEHLQAELALSQRRAGELAERERIARDIHDTVAQAMSSMRLFAHAAAQRASSPTDAASFTQLHDLATDGLTDVRRIIAALTPAELDDGALGEALKRMLHQLEQTTGIRTTLSIDPTLPTLTTATEVALLRAAQSILANVQAHAQARSVSVRLMDEESVVRLDIIDDGVGFNPATVAEKSESYGLRLLRNRIRQLGGDLAVESSPGDGTACSVHLPIHAIDAQIDRQVYTTDPDLPSEPEIEGAS